MRDESNAEALGESASLLGKDESVEWGSLPSAGTSRQYREARPSTSTQSVPHQEERIEVGVDRVCCTWFQRCFPRIFHVVERGHPEELSNLLTNCSTEVQCIDRKGNTALHHAVTSACCKGDWDDRFNQCIDLLMSCEEMDVNMPNKEGYTAIGLAVQHLNRTCIEHMLKHPSAKRLHLDYSPGDRDSTVREIIVEIYPELQPLLPAPLMESLDSTDRNIKLLAALQRGNFEVFRTCLNGTNVNLWFDEPYHSYLLEIACQMKNREEFVRLLLNSGADPNITNRVTGIPLLHATVRSGNFEVLRLLLEQKGTDTSLKDYEERTILHWLAGVIERKPGDNEKIEKCLKLLLKSNYFRQKGVDGRDISGNTAVYIAVERGFRDRAKLLLNAGADFRVFESGSNILLSVSLSILREILDDCLQDNGRPLISQDLQLTLNCQSLMNIVPRIAESKLHRDLLTHPVMSTFLNLKWQKIRIIFILDMVLYAIFLCLLTEYILRSVTYNTVNDGCAASYTTDPFSFNNSNITSGIKKGILTFQSNNSSSYAKQWFLALFFHFLILRKLLQLIVHRGVYLRSVKNWLEILLIVAIVMSVHDNVGAEVKLHFSAIALFLGWSELLLMSGRLPLLSVQYEMLRTVSLTFLRFMVGYVTLLIAFALSFYVLFRGNSEQDGAGKFASPLSSLLKTIFMFAGELEASSLCFDTVPFTSHVIFLLFVVLMAIVLLNLLNGLAVNDTGEIRRNAKTVSLAARAKLISITERMLVPVRKYFCNYVEKTETMFVIYPNRGSRTGSAAVRYLLNLISKRREPKEKDKLAVIREEMRLFKESFSYLQFRHDELEKKLDSKFDETLQILRQILTARHEV